MDARPRMREHPVVIGNVFRRPAAGWVAWILVGVDATLYPFTLYLGLTAGSGLPSLLQFGWWGALGPLLAMEFGIVGALILRRHPGHAVGLLSVIGGFSLSLSAFAGAYAAYSFTHGHLLPATDFAVWLRGWLWYPGFSLVLIMVPALFPDGRLPSPRWRPLVWAVAGGILTEFVWVSLSMLMFGYPLVDGPWPAAGGLFNLLSTVSGVSQVLTIFVAVAAVAVRFRKSRGIERQQLKWFLVAVGLQAVLWAGSLATTALTHQAPYQAPYFEILIPLALLTMPLAIGVAILRQRLYDIDVVISRGLAYAGLATFITAAYLLVVVGVGLALGTGGRPNLPLTIVAVALVGFFIHPARVRLQRLANRLVYGVPADPYTVLAELSRTPTAGTVDHALAQIAEAVARGMGSRQARVDPSVREVRYTPEIEGAAYFVVAEGLAKVLKHSGATEATASIRSNDSCLQVAIADDGHGFDQGAVQQSGLRGLSDRVEALGGHVQIESRGSGTRLDASLPAQHRIT